MIFRLLLLLSALTLPVFKAYGQFNCVDSNRINPYYQCEAYYNPVCGCDGKTYRNSCSAYNQGGNNWNQFDGVCDEFDFDFYPNPSASILNFAIVFKNNFSSASIVIYDIYGKLAYQRNVLGVQRSDFIIELSTMRDGMYVMWVLSGGKAKFRKFVKVGG